MSHHMAPVTRRVSNRKEYWLVVLFSILKRLIPPRIPALGKREEVLKLHDKRSAQIQPTIILNTSMRSNLYDDNFFFLSIYLSIYSNSLARSISRPGV